MSNDNGLFGSLLSGLLGPSDEQLAELRRKYGIPDAEPPSPMASIGRGAIDVWEPAKQLYLDHTDPVRAAAYRQQRSEDERLYQRGLLASNPLPSDAPNWARADMLRGVGQGMVAAPLLLPGMSAATALPLREAIMSMLGTSGLYGGLNDVRRKYGILPDFMP
jgi:hypothetical protein